MPRFLVLWLKEDVFIADMYLGMGAFQRWSMGAQTKRTEPYGSARSLCL